MSFGDAVASANDFLGSSNLLPEVALTESSFVGPEFQLNFNAGVEYNINVKQTVYGEFSAGLLFLSKSKIDIKYAGDHISMGGMSSGAGLGFEFMSGAVSNKVKFHQNVSGKNLKDVFNKANLISSATKGALLKVTTITGYDDARTMNPIWSVKLFGGGVGVATFSGDRSIGGGFK